MTPELARALIDGGETLDVEFKGEERTQLSDSELIESVVCMANRRGTELGWIFVGVEDDGRVTGARSRHEANKTDPLRVRALIANQTRPALTATVELVQIRGQEILAIGVPASRTPVGTTKGLYLRRALGGRGEPQCLPFHYHEMQSAQADWGLLDHSALAIPEARWEDLDPLEFERFRRTIGESHGLGDAALVELPDVEIAAALGAVHANGSVTQIRVLGLLLFGRENALRRLLPTHEVAFQVLSSLEVQVNDFFCWPLLRAMEELMGRFRARNREQELAVGHRRVGVPDYSERGFREAVANALIHRDYTRLGAVHVQWRDEEIEVSNPGGFPEGVHLDNLLVTSPRPRNPLLADAFKRAGIVERTARGIDTIYREQLRSGRRLPSYERSSGASVVLILPGGRANLAFARLVAEQADAGRPLILDDLLLLSRLLQDHHLKTPDAARAIQKREGEALARLESLVEMGLAEARGERSSRVWHLSAATYRRLGEESAYDRLLGLEPLQQERMVLQYVGKHGRITRRRAADLCRLSSSQARDLLARLVRGGRLALRGRGRGAYYEKMAKELDRSNSETEKSKTRSKSSNSPGESGAPEAD